MCFGTGKLILATYENEEAKHCNFDISHEGLWINFARPPSFLSTVMLDYAEVGLSPFAKLCHAPPPSF